MTPLWKTRKSQRPISWWSWFKRYCAACFMNLFVWHREIKHSKIWKIQMTGASDCALLAISQIVFVAELAPQITQQLAQSEARHETQLLSLVISVSKQRHSEREFGLQPKGSAAAKPAPATTTSKSPAPAQVFFFSMLIMTLAVFVGCMHVF